MARGNRSSAVRGSRGAFDLRDRRRTGREVELTIRDGMRVLRLMFRGVSLLVCYHERGETADAFQALRRGAEALAEASLGLGLNERATADLILSLIKEEVGLQYDAETTDRLVGALRQTFRTTGSARVTLSRAEV